MDMRCWRATALTAAVGLTATLATSLLEPTVAKPVVASEGKHATERKQVQRPIRGKVSWYGPRFEGKPTANGERFDSSKLTMAHRTLPLGTLVEVRNPENDRRVVVRVNDRGPYIDGRIADLSKGAAEALGMVQHGVIVAELRVIA